MAQVSNIGKGIQNGFFCTTDLHKTQKPKSLCSVWLGSELKSLSFGGLKYERRVVGFGDSVKSVRVSRKISASVSTTGKPSTAPEILLQPIKEISGTIKLPGSKSLSNRILLLAALSEVNFWFFYF